MARGSIRRYEVYEASRPRVHLRVGPYLEYLLSTS